MGRRALPKMDPAVDLSGHLFELGALPCPLDVRTWFANPDLPLEIEIGSGKGLFLLNESAARPDSNFAGIEISKKYCRYAAWRLAREGRTNARMVRGDGVDFVRRWLADRSVSGLHVYFPDPWWKARHRRRRVVREELVVEAGRVIVPGGRFHFWTDVEEYFDEGCNAVTSSGLFDGPFPDHHGSGSGELETGARFLTHFERRMLLKEHDVFRARFLRRPSAAAEAV